MFRLISFNLCPYVQRSVITLEEKRSPYEIEYIDLNQKPDWFLQLSPTGKVPVLQVTEQVGGRTINEVLFESAIISEYLDEVTGEPRLLPQDPLMKAKAKAWIEFTSTMIADAHHYAMAASREAAMAILVSLRLNLQRIGNAKAKAEFFLGKDFSLVDAAIAPALLRLRWCEKIAPEIKIYSDMPIISEWAERLLARESVKKSTVPNIEQIYREYLQGRGSPTRNVEPSWLGRL